jgi:Flp pilus assembly protein TadG
MFMRKLGRARKAAVSVMFAAATVPMLGLVGLAVDYGIWNQVNSGLALAANVAALTAVKVAANAQLAVDSNAQTEGQNAGKQWFMAEIGVGNSATSAVGTTPVTLTSGYPNVQVTMGATVTATVTYNATVKSIFGGFLFGIGNYYVSGQAQAQVASAPYLNVELLLDNSSSMQIGATVQDQITLMSLSTCAPVNWIPNYGYGGNQSADVFPNFKYNYAGQVYDGAISTQGGNGFLAVNPATGATLLIPQSSAGQGTFGRGVSCDPLLPANEQGQGYFTGPPCAFACHWVQGNSSGTAQDELGIARSTIGKSYQVTLRFDLLKNATQQILQTMAADDEQIRNLKVGIFTFNSTVTQVYPSSGEASDGWSAAESAVGLPPATSTAQETGIQPVVGGQYGDNDNTAFPEAMTTLQNQYLTTPAGNGTVSTAPRKVLIIITDGFLDDPNIAYPNDRAAFPPSACAGFKNMGYTVYVVYTPYNPIMHMSYLMMDWSVIVSGTGPTSISYNLQQCASSGSDYIAATSQSQLNDALTLFLKSALNQPARFVI